MTIKVEIFLLFIMSFIAHMVLDIHLPSLPELREQLGISQGQAQLIFTLGYMQLIFMPLVWGALIDIMGMKKVIISSLIISIVGQLLCANATTFLTLLFFRSIQFLGGGSINNLIMVHIYNNFSEEKRARLIGFNELLITFSLIVGPILGGIYNWKQNFYILAFAQITLFFFVAIFFNKKFSSFRTKGDIRPAIKELLNKKFLVLIFLISIIEALIVVFCVTSPFIYIEYYGLGKKTYVLQMLIPLILNLTFLSLFSIYSIFKSKFLFLACEVGILIFCIVSLIFYIFINKIHFLYVTILISFLNIIVAFILPTLNSRLMNFFNGDFPGISSSISTFLIRLICGSFLLISSLISSNNIFLVMFCISLIALLLIHLN